MLNPKASSISLSTFLSTGGAAGGYAITHKLAGHDAALSYFYFASSIVATLMIVQIIFAIKSEVRAACLVLFNICFVIGVAWFMLCLILPMFWVPEIDISAKIILSFAAVTLCSANISKGMKLFGLRWTQAGAGLLSRYYNHRDGAIEWEALMGALRMAVSIYIPGLPEKLNPIISIIIVASMLAGLSFRNVFPLFSLFAWGIPIVIVVSLIAQMIGLGVGQLLMLTALEKKEKTIIRPS